jgi:hypothetical protein
MVGIPGKGTPWVELGLHHPKQRLASGVIDFPVHRVHIQPGYQVEPLP